MFSVYVKGERNRNDADMVKLTMIFYRTGYCRAEKVLYISGLYSEWDHGARCFKPASAENVAKNRLLQKERIKYLNIAERWEYSGKAWLPIELTHYFDDTEKTRSKYLTVSQVFDILIEQYEERMRVRNGNAFSGIKTAVDIASVKRSLKKFTASRYSKDFSKLHFRDIDTKFLLDYVYNEQQEGAKSGNKGGVRQKITRLYGVFVTAKEMGVYNINLTTFSPLKVFLKPYKYLSKATSHETMMKFEKMDKSGLSKCQRLHIDLFLFSYYAGGMSGIDICHLEHSWIKGNTIEYERIKFDSRARIILTDMAMNLIEKYKKESSMDYVFPVFKLRNQSLRSRYYRVNYITKHVNATLRDVGVMLGIYEKITWSTARSSFISKMLDEGYHPLQVAEQTGNSPRTIHKHYYSITNIEEVKRKMDTIFQSENQELKPKD